MVTFGMAATPSRSSNCIETASGNSVILVRDTANRDGGTLKFSTEAWEAFAASLKR